MKHAIIVTGGKQYRVAEGDVIFVEKLDKVAGENKLTVSSLGAKTLGLAVAAVLGRTHTFFMCH